MIAFTPAPTSPDPRFAESDSLEMRRPANIVAQQETAIRNARNFRFPQKLIPLDDRNLLRLRKAPVVTVDTRTMEFDVQNWGIKMPCSEVHELPRQIGRRFLMLFSKGDSQNLSAEERLQWLQVLDQVDYPRFSFDRSAPQYTEGKLVRKNPYKVEWHDGSIEVLPAALGAVLHLLDSGDTFSAFIKAGADNRTLAIERVCLI
jgi:hypothetical protein